MDIVSVIIPTYNRAHLVADALNSVWAQMYRPIECIVVDDGSTDNTAQVVSEWKREHDSEQFSVQFLQQENQGAQAARNKGMATATGKFLLFLDSDDRLAASALTTLVQAQEEQNADIVYGDFRWFYEDGRKPTVQKQRPPSDQSVISVLKNCPRTSTALIDSSVVGKVCWRAVPRAHEFTFFLDLALSGAVFGWIEEIVLEAFDHSGETRINNDRSDTALRPRTIGSYLLEVEDDLRACGEKATAACDRALVYFAGILYRKGHRSEAEELFRRAHRGRALKSTLQNWRTSVFLPALLTPRWSAKVYKALRR